MYCITRVSVSLYLVCLSVTLNAVQALTHVDWYSLKLYQNFATNSKLSLAFNLKDLRISTLSLNPRILSQKTACDSFCLFEG